MPDNLPHPLTSFIGREHEIADVRRLLRMTRLLTLTGTGGVGKTRLGLVVARSLLDEFPDGVWLVELSALDDPALVPNAVASALDVREDPKRPLTASLCDALRHRRLLLVLDNCEHLIQAAAELTHALLRSCTGLHVLATSRQPLGVAGETTFHVPSLSLQALPDLEPGSAAGQDGVPTPIVAWPMWRGRTASPDASEAVRLFVDRAQAVAHAFTLTDRSTAAVEQICRRLDGIPLAIELAAARVAVLSPEQIASRLCDRFHLLSGGSRAALPRYRTLRALIDWSHDLLDERERILLRRLAVFASSWTLEAAESVCADDALPSAEILDLLSGLVTKSLVLRGGRDDETRYRFLESIREYAAVKLREADEETILCERHGTWFLALAERAEPELTGPSQAAWFARLDCERENLRATQRWAATRGDADTLVRLGAALWMFWHERSNAADARELLDAIVPLARQATPTPALARALRGAGTLAGTIVDFATCRALLEDGLDVARQLDDRRLLATMQDSLGRQLFVEGQYVDARILLNEGAAIFREIDDGHGLSRALSHIGFLEYLEDRQELACAIYREGLELARASGDLTSIGEFLDNLGRTSQAAGDLDGAARTYQEAVAIWRGTGQGNWLAMTLNNLGSVHALRGDVGAARAHLEESLSLSQRLGNRRRLAFTLAAAATLAAVDGQPERAVRLDAAAAVTAAELGFSLVQPAYAPHIPHLERARRALGPAAAASATATGQMTPLAQAVDETLAWLAEPERFAEVDPRPIREPFSLSGPESASPVVSAPTVVATTAPASRCAELSRRELEVAALIARGMTNRQIANELVITEGTAANHVKHILARLTLRSRVQIATWAIEHGLLQRPAS